MNMPVMLNNLRTLLCCGVVLSLPLVARAADGQLHGHVFGQDESGEPIGPVAGAKVELLDAQDVAVASAECNNEGYYLLTELAAGPYIYRVTAPGFRPEAAGRGLEILRDHETAVLDFTLTRGRLTEPVPQGTLKVRVLEVTPDGERVIRDAVVAAGCQTQGRVQFVSGDNSGNYQTALSTGVWRVTAKAPGHATVAYRSTVTIKPDAVSHATIIFRRKPKQVDETKAVEALVAVQDVLDADRVAAPKLPTVQFLTESGDQTCPAVVRRASDSDLRYVGVSASNSYSGWHWFVATPEKSLAAGEYRAEASLDGYTSVASAARTVTTSQKTYFDLTLRSTENPSYEEPARPSLVTTTWQLLARNQSSIHGRVFGQDDQGQSLGTLAGARIELADANDRVVASVVADDSGYYIVQDLKPGELQYRVSAPEFVSDVGRGFEILESNDASVIDFTLTRGQDVIPQGRVACIVQEKASGSVARIEGATVRLWREQEKKVLETPNPLSGKFESSLNPGVWFAAAMAPGFSSGTAVQVTVKNKELSEVVFTLEHEAAPAEVSALVAVLRVNDDGQEVVPAVHFVGGANNTIPVRIAAEVHPVAEPELSPAANSQARWDWYWAKPKSTLTVGTYHVEGQLTNYPIANSAVIAIENEDSTIYNLVLRPTPELGELAGVVKDTSNEMPLAGAIIELKHQATSERKTLHATADGGFEAKLGPGLWWATAHADGCLDTVPASIKIEKAESARHDFLLSKKPTDLPVAKVATVKALVGVLATKANSEHGAPLVQFISGDGAHDAVTRKLDEAEIASLGATANDQQETIWTWYWASPIEQLKPGRYRAHGVLDGYVTNTSESKFAQQGETTYLHLALRSDDIAQRGAIAGFVRNEAGQPIPSATIRFWRNDQTESCSLKPSAAGDYSIELVEGVWWTVACAEGHACTEPIQIEIAAEGKLHYDFVLAKLRPPTHVTALVAVEGRCLQVETAPTVSFVGAGTKIEAQVRRVDTAVEPVTSATSESDWIWFEATPVSPLKRGDYHAVATLTGFLPDKAAVQTVSEGQSLTFHHTLRSIIPPEDRLVEIVGTVYVEGENGEKEIYKGPVVAIEPYAPHLAPEHRTYDEFALKNGKYRARIKPGCKLVWPPHGYQISEGDAFCLTACGNHQHDITLKPHALGGPDNYVLVQLKGPHSGPVALPSVEFQQVVAETLIRNVEVPVVHCEGVVQQTREQSFKLVRAVNPRVRGRVQPLLESIDAVADDGSRWYIARPAEPLNAGASYLFYVEAEGFRGNSWPEFIMPPAGQASTVLRIVSLAPNWTQPETGNWSGHVVRADQPDPSGVIANVTFLARNSAINTTQIIRTDESGHFEVNVQPGNWTVIAAEGFRVVEGSAFVIEGGVVYHDLVKLERHPPSLTRQVEALIAVEKRDWAEASSLPAVVFERIRRENERDTLSDRFESVVKRLSGAELDARGFSASDRQADRWAWYSAVPKEAIPVGEYRAGVSLEGYTTTSGDPRTVTCHSATVFDIVLEVMRPQVEVLVLRTNQQPVVGASVKLINLDLGQRLADASHATTNGSGRCTIDLVAGAGRYNLFVTGSGMQPEGIEHLISKPNSELSIVVYSEGESRTGTFAAHVENGMTGQAIANAHVWVEPITNAELVAEPPAASVEPLACDAQGACSRDGFPVGEYQITIEAPGYRPLTDQVTIRGGNLFREFKLILANAELDRLIGLMLTEGWGDGEAKAEAAERYYQLALEAAGKGEIDFSGDAHYAAALVNCRNRDFQRALLAISKGQPKLSMSYRATHVEIWLKMNAQDFDGAMRDMLRAVQGGFTDAEASYFSRETSNFMGKCCGVLKGPWKDRLPSDSVNRFEQSMLQTLTGIHRDEFRKGVEWFLSEHRRVEQAIADGRNTQTAENERVIAALRKQLEAIREENDARRETAIARIKEIAEQIALLLPGRDDLAKGAARMVASIRTLQSELDTVNRSLTQRPNDKALLESQRIIQSKLIVAGRELRKLESRLAKVNARIETHERERKNVSDAFQKIRAEFTKEYEQLLRELTALEKASLPLEPSDQEEGFDKFMRLPLDMLRCEMLNSIGVAYELPDTAAPTTGEVEMTINNRTQDELGIFYMAADTGQNIKYMQLRPTASGQLQSYVGHRWFAADRNGQRVAEFTVPNRATTTWTIGGNADRKSDRD